MSLIFVFIRNLVSITHDDTQPDKTQHITRTLKRIEHQTEKEKKKKS